LVILVAVAAGSCDGNQGRSTPVPEAPAARVPFRVVHAAPVSAVVPPRDAVQTRLVRSSSEWASAWEKLTANAVPALPPPAVDFSRDQVLLVLAGPPARKLRTITVGRTGTDLHVVVELSYPAPDCGTTAELRSPFQFLAISKGDDQTVSTEVTRIVEHC